MFWISLSYRLGRDVRIPFWKDKWCPHIPPCSTFPHLYALAPDKDEAIRNYRGENNEGYPKTNPLQPSQSGDTKEEL